MKQALTKLCIDGVSTFLGPGVTSVYRRDVSLSGGNPFRARVDQWEVVEVDGYPKLSLSIVPPATPRGAA